MSSLWLAHIHINIVIQIYNTMRPVSSEIMGKTMAAEYHRPSNGPISFTVSSSPNTQSLNENCIHSKYTLFCLCFEIKFEK